MTQEIATLSNAKSWHKQRLFCTKSKENSFKSTRKISEWLRSYKNRTEKKNTGNLKLWAWERSLMI